MAAGVIDSPTSRPNSGDVLDMEAWTRQRAVMLAFGRRICNSDGAGLALIDDAALLLAETLGLPMCGSAQVSGDGTKLLLRLLSFDGAAREVQAPWNASSSGFDSLAAYCLAKHEVVVCADLADAQFRDVFLKTAGVKSGLGVPLESPERPLGALTLLSPVARCFTSQDVEFAEAIGHTLTATLARIQLDCDLKYERHVAATMFDESSGISVLTNHDGLVLRASRVCELLLDEPIEQLLSRPLANFLTTEGAQEAHRLARLATSQQTGSAGVVTFRSRQGRERRVTIRARVLPGGRQPDSVLYCGEIEPDREAAPDFVQPFQEMRDPGAPVRSSPRRAFPYRQRIAPFEPGKPLATLPFVEVQFEDISAGGVSFYLDYHPDFETVVLALGAGANLHYLTANIVNVTEMARSGKRHFKIGCRFLERY